MDLSGREWRVWIGLGANLPGPAGSPGQTLRAAIAALGELGTVTACSGLWLTRPVGPVRDQPPFFNAVAELKTGWAPRDLIGTLLELERRFGRVRGEADTLPKGPRTLDLDMLLAEELLDDSATLPVVCYSWNLMLPHPEMDRRGFVLHPLAEIAPGLRHPLLRKTVAELLASLPEDDGVQLLTEPASIADHGYAQAVGSPQPL